MIILLRTIIIILSLALWHFTQKLLARRNVLIESTNSLTDGIHQLTAKQNQALLDNPKVANLLLIVSSLVIDLLGFYLLISAIFGKTFQPFLGLFLVFALRQICQAFCPLPPPKGMIWRNPGFPSLLVTYGTSCDLFFSGHTAIAIYGAATLAATLGPLGIALGCLIAVFEIVTVLILRAHYTMDVFTGAIAALYVYHLAAQLSPHIDLWIRHFAS
jgi:PAP2 superfamily C-terminal